MEDKKKRLKNLFSPLTKSSGAVITISHFYFTFFELCTGFSSFSFFAPPTFPRIIIIIVVPVLLDDLLLLCCFTVLDAAASAAGRPFVRSAVVYFPLFMWKVLLKKLAVTPLFHNLLVSFFYLFCCGILPRRQSL